VTALIFDIFFLSPRLTDETKMILKKQQKKKVVLAKSACIFVSYLI
jgi:hypothetical protein